MVSKSIRPSPGYLVAQLQLPCRSYLRYVTIHSMIKKCAKADPAACYAGGPEEGGGIGGPRGGGGPGGRISLACIVVVAPGLAGPGGGGIRIPGIIPGGIIPGIPGIIGNPGRGNPGIPGIMPGIIPGGGIIPGIINIPPGGRSIGSGAGLLSGMLFSLQKFS